MEEGDHQSSNNSHDSIIIDNEASSSSFLQQFLPEPIKLIAASFLVAFILHHFFFKEQKKKWLSFRVLLGISTDDGVDGGNILGSVDALIEEEEDDEYAISSSEEVLSHQSLPQTTTECVETKVKKRKKQMKPAKKASETRNYDKLICNKTLPSDDDIEPTEAQDVTNSSLDQDKTSSSSTSTQPETQTQQQQQQEEQLQLHSQATHPGLSAYYNWHSTITSLYRIYAIPSTDIVTTNNTLQQHPAVLPMHPSSERGNIGINITVVNQTRYELIEVYWIDYKGNEVYKGNVPRGGRWVQSTYIGHPWTFRIGGGSESNGGEEDVLLKYVPFRITPTVLGADTTGREGATTTNYPRVGTQMFTLRDVPEGYVTRNEGYKPACWVDDMILPEPPLIDTYNNNGERNLSLFTTHEMQMAIQWSCFQLQREDASSPGTGVTAAKRLLKYLQNICMHPENAKYRKLRVGNRIFFDSVYNTGARGVLLALGFEELMGFLECGPSEGALNYERLRQISDAMMVVNKTLKLMVEGEGVEQPEGSDGYGRAGFGYAGQLNI